MGGLCLAGQCTAGTVRSPTGTVGVGAVSRVVRIAVDRIANTPRPVSYVVSGLVWTSRLFRYVQGLAFDTKEIDLPAGQPTTITLDNQDAGIPHNLAIYTDDSLSTALFQGEQFPGIDSREYQIPAIDPGTYYFHCDVHPTMNGTVVVGGSGGGSGATGASPSG